MCVSDYSFSWHGIGINNDSGSTGDASSTTGELVGSDGAAAAALSGGYGDGAPLVCIPSKSYNTKR